MDTQKYISAEVEKLASPFAEHACCNLWTMTSAIIPQLTEAFWAERNPEIRANLIYVVWKFREKSTAPFLIEAMDDVHDQVWMNALDGLISIGGEDVTKRLIEFMTTLNPDDIRGAWVMEAIEQISEAAE